MKLKRDAFYFPRETRCVDTDRRWPAWKVGYFVGMGTLGLAALFLVAFFVAVAVSGGSII